MTKSSIAPLLAQALAPVGGSLGVRVEAEDDLDIITALYAEVRHDELAPLPWPDKAKRDFLDAQCRLQRDHYARHYAGAELLIIERGGQPIGRIYVHATATEIRLMEITVQAAERNRGIGTCMIRALQDEAARRAVPLTLHVEPANPAQRMYRRLGFRLIENRGVYDFLGWGPGMENGERGAGQAGSCS